MEKTLSRFESVHKDFYELLVNQSGSYDLTNWSSGRIALVGTRPQLLGISPNDDEIRFLRKAYQERRELDYKCVVDGVEKLLRNVYDRELVTPPELKGVKQEMIHDDFDEIIRSEGELARKLVDEIRIKKNSSLDGETQRVIETIQQGHVDPSHCMRNPVHMVLYGKDKCRDLPFTNMGFRMKSYESSFLKDIEKKRKVLAPTKDEMKSYTSKNFNGSISQKDVSDFFTAYMQEALSSGVDFHTYFLCFPPSCSPINQDEFGGRFGGEINEVIGDSVFVDIAGALFMTPPNTDVVSMGNTIKYSLPQFDTLPHKVDDPSQGDKKDGSVVLGLTGNSEADFAEFRLIPQSTYLESLFGSSTIRSHYAYKRSKIKKISKTLDKSQALNEAVSNAQRFYNVSLEDILELHDIR